MEIQSVLHGAGAFEHVAKMSRMVDSPPKEPPAVSLPPVRLRLSVFPLVSPPSSHTHDILSTTSKPRSMEENDSQTKSNKLRSSGHTREEDGRSDRTDSSEASVIDTDMDHKQEAEKERQRNKERQRRLQMQQDKEKDKENTESDTEKKRDRRHKKEKRKRLKDAVKKAPSEEDIVPQQQESCTALPGTAARRRKEARSKRWRKIEHSPPDILEGKKPGRNMRATPSSRSRTSSMGSGSTVNGSVARDKELLTMLLEQQRSQQEPSQDKHKERSAVKAEHKKKTNEASSRSNKKKYHSECDSLPVSVSSSRPPLYDTDISAQTEPGLSKLNQRPSALDRLLTSGSLSGLANNNNNENAHRPRAQREREKNRTKNERSSRRSKSKTAAASAWDSNTCEPRDKSSHPQVPA